MCAAKSYMWGVESYMCSEKSYMCGKRSYVCGLSYMCGTDFYIIVLQKLRYLSADNKSANGHPYMVARVNLSRINNNENTDHITEIDFVGEAAPRITYEAVPAVE